MADRPERIITRDFILVFFAQLAISGTYNLLIPTLPIYLSKLGSGEVEIGIHIGALSVSSLILRFFVGKALLKTPEKNFLLGGALLFMVSSLAYLIAPPFWPFFLVRILQGVGQAFFYTASTILIANISPEGHRAQSMAYFYLAFNFAFAVAPTLGMFVISNFGFTLLFLFCAALSLCSLLLATRLKKRQIDPSHSAARDVAFLNRETLPPAVISFFAHFLWGSVTAFFPLYTINHGVSNPGFFFGVYAITLILGRMLGRKIMDRSKDKIMIPCLTCYIFSMVVLSFSKTLPMFIFVTIVWGIGSAFLFPILVVFIINHAGASRGPIMGTFTAVGDLGAGLGPVIMGIVQ